MAGRRFPAMAVAEEVRGCLSSILYSLLSLHPLPFLSSLSPPLSPQASLFPLSALPQLVPLFHKQAMPVETVSCHGKGPETDSPACSAAAAEVQVVVGLCGGVQSEVPLPGPEVLLRHRDGGLGYFPVGLVVHGYCAALPRNQH